MYVTYEAHAVFNLFMVEGEGGGIERNEVR